MHFSVVGILFFTFGILFAFNIAKGAECAFQIYARLNPTVGIATPQTLRIVGGFWIPLGAFFIMVGFFR